MELLCSSTSWKHGRTTARRVCGGRGGRKQEKWKEGMKQESWKRDGCSQDAGTNVMVNRVPITM